MSEKYRLIKHNENLAEIGNDRGVGLLFLVDEDCERKLEIIVYLLNKLYEENEQLRKQCFELEKDYLIETSDISDKIYLDDEIKELKQKYGVKDE